MDELKRYVETRVGISLLDEFYFHCINQLSTEMVRYEVAKELKDYLSNHNDKQLSVETIAYVKKRIKLFKDNLSSTYFPGVQDINYHTVKEISVMSKHEKYEDLLRMSANWISYKKQFGNKEETWSYKTQSKEYFHKYEIMIETFEHLYKCPPEFEFDDNEYKISIRVTFNDDSYITFYRTSSFGHNSMYQQAIAIIKLIPHNEDIPCFLKPFKETILTNEISNEVKDEDIIGIFYGGDMGRIGGLDIVTKDYKVISSDNNQGELNIYKFAEKLNSVCELHDCHFMENKIIKTDKEHWYPVYLGAGNRVLLNGRLYHDLIDYLFDAEPPVSYSKWNKLVLE